MANCSPSKILCQRRILRHAHHGLALAAVMLVVGNVEAKEALSSEELVSRLVEESQKHQVVRSSDPQDILRQAETHAVELAADVSSYNHWMQEIIQGYVKKGQLDDAEYLVNRLPGYGSAQAHAILALHYARLHQAQKAIPHLNVALKQVEQMNGLPAENLRSQCVLAMYHLGEKKEVASQMAKLGRLSLLSLETELHEQGLVPAITVLDAKRRLVAVPDQGEDERHARFLLACAQQQFVEGHPEVGQAFLEEIGRMSVENGLPNAQRVLVDLARTAWAGGRQQLARKSMNVFLKCCEAYGDGADWKPVFLADAVEVLISWNEPDQAKEWLKVAEKSMKRVFVLEAPAGYIALARQHESLGHVKEADDLLMAALKAGASYKHPRAKAEAAVRVCLYFSEVGRSMPTQMAQYLSQATAEVDQ